VVLVRGSPVADAVKKKGRKRRAALLAAGLRPVEIWVPDTSRPGFDEECRRQSLVVAAADTADRNLGVFLDVTLSDLDSEFRA
jgi:hypothetical protein